MDAEEYAARLDALIENLVGLYNLIDKLFALLPIPISIPSLWDEREGAGPSEVDDLTRPLARARELLGDLPIDSEFRAMVDMAIVEWLGAFDTLGLADADLRTRGADADSYRLDVAWLATQRIFKLIEGAARHFGLDL